MLLGWGNWGRRYAGAGIVEVTRYLAWSPLGLNQQGPFVESCCWGGGGELHSKGLDLFVELKDVIR